MTLISLPAAITLTARSERTLWRMFADGSAAREVVNGKAMFSLESIKPFLCIPIDAEDLLLVEEADKGDAEAQTDLALIFLSNRKFKEAIFWLELAAEQGYADAMNWLGRCYIHGDGIEKNENVGMMWLAKAAANGHAISKAQMKTIRNRFKSSDAC